MSYSHNDFLYLGRANVWYNENRERLYERFINWTAFISLMFSSAAFVAMGPLFPDAWQPAKDAVLAIIALVVTGLNGAMLAFGMFGKYILHANLKREWIQFLALLQVTKADNLDAIAQRFEEINGREPAVDPKIWDQAQDKTREALGWVQPSA
ncbi:MAG: hypothetical protein WAU60_08435 [Candidatus Competibacter denitrificans]|jgi:hypothetical protein